MSAKNTMFVSCIAQQDFFFADQLERSTQTIFYFRRMSYKYEVCFIVIESLSKRRFSQHGRQPEVNRVVIDGE